MNRALQEKERKGEKEGTRKRGIERRKERQKRKREKEGERGRKTEREGDKKGRNEKFGERERRKEREGERKERMRGSGKKRRNKREEEQERGVSEGMKDGGRVRVRVKEYYSVNRVNIKKQSDQHHCCHGNTLLPTTTVPMVMCTHRQPPL